MRASKGAHATIADYREALSSLSASEQRLLVVHYLFPSHRATPRQLAERLGYQSYGGANLAYGRIGGRVGRFLLPRLPHPQQPSTYSWGNLATYDTDGPEVAWTLRPELAQALKVMPWFPADDDVTAYRKATGFDLESAREVLVKMKPELRKRVLRAARSQSGGEGQLRDPVEDDPSTREFVRQAAAEADRLVTDQGLGRCHSVWERQARILWREHKIRWYSPAEMNPLDLFD